MASLARPVFLVPLVLLLVLIGAGAWWWSRAGSSTQVSGEQAARDHGDGPAGRVIAGGPRAGVWSYRSGGDETVGAGPVTVDRKIPRSATIVVRPAPGGFWRTLVLSEEHVEASRIRVAPEGEYLEERVTTLTVAGLGRDDRQVLVPPPLSMPRAPEPGDTWTERYRMDDVRVVVRARVLRRGAQKVGGESVPVVLIEKKAMVSGPLEGFRNDRMWWSPDLRMPVRWRITTELDGFAALRSDSRMVLAAAGPAA